MSNQNPVNPEAASLASFIDQAHANGNGAIDPNIIASIGVTMGNNPGAHAVLGGIKDGLSKAHSDNGHFFSDPAIHQQPNFAQQVSDHFKNTGIPKVTEPTILDIQNKMIKAGYGKGLKANGAWSPDWENQSYQMHLDNQNKPAAGTTGARKLFGEIFSPMLLSHAIPLIVSMAKSTVSGVAGTFAAAEKGREKLASVFGVPQSDQQYSSMIGHAADSVARLTNNQKTQTLDQYIKTPLGMNDAINVINTALTVSTIGKGVEEGFLALKGAVTAGKEAGATTLAGSLFKDLGPDATKRSDKWIMNSLLPQVDANTRRFAFTKALQNAPILDSMTGGLNQVATKTANGWMAARSTLATPYRLPIIGALGKIGGSIIPNAGLKLGLIGNEEKFLGDPNGPQALALDHLKPIAGVEGNALDLLQVGLHAPHYDINAIPNKTIIGTKVEDLRNRLVSALNQNSVIANWERGTGMSYRRVVGAAAKAGIPQSAVDSSILDNFNQMAARHAAQSLYQEKVNNGLINGLDDDLRMNYLREVSHAIRNDEAKMSDAIESYQLKPGIFAKDLNKSILNMKSDSTYSYAGDFISKLRSDEIMRNGIIPHADSLITPETISKLALNPEVKDLPYGYSHMADFAKKELEKAQSRQALAQNKLADMGISGKLKTAAEGSEPIFKINKIANPTDEQKMAIQAYKDSIKLVQSAKKRLASASKGGIVKNAFNIDDAERAAINGDTLIPSIGRMKIERQTQGDAQAMAGKFFKELETAKPGFKAPALVDRTADAHNMENPWDLTKPAPKVTETRASKLPKDFNYEAATPEEVTLRNKIFQYLGEELNRNIKDLQYVPTENLIDLIVEKSKWLAGDIHIPLDAPAALIDHVEKLKNEGYKLVYGTDIGHAYSATPLNLNLLGKEQNTMSKIADKLGLDFQQVDPQIAAQHSYSQMLNVTQDEIVKNPSQYPAWATASRLTNYLQTVIKPDMNWLVSGQLAFNTSRAALFIRPLKGGMWNKEIEQLMKEKTWTDSAGKVHQYTRSMAKTEIQDSLTKDVGPQYWTRKQVVQALTSKGNPENGLTIDKFGREIEAPAMSEKAANDFYYAMQKGLRDAPTYVNGQSPLTKMVNSTFGLANIPLAINGHRVLDLTGSLQKQLLAFRYQGSYRFAYLRAVKSAIKGVTENIPFTLDAVGALKALGPKEEAKAYDLAIRYGVHTPAQQELSDYITKEFDQADIYNVYNPRAIEARNIYYLHKDSLEAAGGDASKIDKAALVKKFDNITSYGNRTAAEKTVNAFFFPFSFEKTVMRQLGGHLLDDAGTRYITAQAIALYDSADGQKIKSWMETNMPLFKELEKFNPFYHGIGLGQFGGINRMPYDVLKTLFGSMLGPQPLTTKDSVKAAMALVPAYRDLSNILLGVDPNGKKPTQWGGEALSTARQGAWEAGNALSKLFFHTQENNPWDPQSHLTYDAQQKNGWNLRSELITKVAKVLEANRAGASYAWPTNIPRVGGQKVSTATINELINHVYPKWEASQILIAVAKQKDAISKEREVIQSKAPDYLPLYDKVVTYSDQLQSVINKSDSKLDTSTLATAMDKLREAMRELSLQDNSFASFYKRYYESKYGPLEGI